MCGDLDEDDASGTRAFEAFRHHATQLAAAARKRGGDPDSVDAWLDRVFADILTRLADENDAPAVAPYQRVAMAPVVLARVAGLLAGHTALAEDPLRRTMEALMLGYAEPEAFFRAHRDSHGHDHDHDHDHDHGHGHHHHHDHHH